jgi:GDP-L-fucose synthase
MKKNKIWITGSNGMVGQALNRSLVKKNNYEVIKTTRKNFDQTNQNKTKNWIIKNQPDVIIITSALVGGPSGSSEALSCTSDIDTLQMG